MLFLAWYVKQEVPEVLGSQFPQIQPNFGKFRRLGATPSSYMTLITWKQEDGKKFGSRVFEGFIIADKQPKFYRTNAAHVYPSRC